jgi:hypothetical protein
MTNTPSQIVHATQEFLDAEFAKPEWQARLTSCPPRHLFNARFPPSDEFPSGGTTMHFEMYCDNVFVALLDKDVPHLGDHSLNQWKPQALLIGDKWHIL